jgi:DNA-binding XRE family transcriptional regulator
MSKKAVIEASSLPALAKKFREASGKNRAEAARDLGVARPSVIQAEERPDINLSKLRKRIIERYSPYELVGPVFYLKKKS